MNLMLKYHSINVTHIHGKKQKEGKYKEEKQKFTNEKY